MQAWKIENLDLNGDDNVKCKLKIGHKNLYFSLSKGYKLMFN